MAFARSILPLLLLCAATPALAEDNPPLIGPRTLALFPKGVEACYRASFDDAQRKAHPGQILTEFQLSRLFRPDPLMEEIDKTAAEQVKDDMAPDMPSHVTVLAKLNDGKGYYDQSLECNDSDKGGMYCGVECDGGTFDMQVEGGKLKLTFDNSYGVRLNEGCGDPDVEHPGHMLTGKETGGPITIAPAPIEACAATSQEARPRFAADPVPLRDRITNDGWRCLKRVYGKTHLASHPKQKVTAIALHLKGPVTTETDDTGSKTTHLAVTFALATRDGKHASKNLDCIAYAYEFSCGEEGDGFRIRRRDQSSASVLAGFYDEPLRALAGLTIGSDDKLFRLDASQDADCALK